VGDQSGLDTGEIRGRERQRNTTTAGESGSRNVRHEQREGGQAQEATTSFGVGIRKNALQHIDGLAVAAI
jgi:hypothetical protein